MSLRVAPAAVTVTPSAALGVALMLVGMFLFASNDALGKWLVATYTVGQVLLIRSAAALLILGPMAWRAGAPALVRVERPWLQTLRVVLSTAEVFCFYSAVVYLPLADVMTYWLAAPIYVAAMSPFLLGEKVGWRRWTAIAVGFVGVMIALQPSAEALTWPALISIAGSWCFGMMMLTGRMLRGTPDTTLVFWQTLGALAAGLVLAPIGWVTPTLFDLGLLALVGIVAMLAHIFVNRALKLADAVIVAPFQYTLLLWAIVYGYLVFGDVPAAHTLIGGGIIIAAGFFIFLRERKATGRETPPPLDSEGPG